MPSENKLLTQSKNRPCAGCDKVRKLCKSHSIPKRFFSKTGQISNCAGSDKRVHHKVDTGWDMLLCEECEGQLGSNFDKPAREWTRELSSAETLDPSMLARFMCSVFWRASISQHFMYKGFLADNPSMTMLLKYGTLKDTQFQIGSYTIQKLVDPSGGFDQDDLNTIVMPPIHRVSEQGPGLEQHHFRTAFGGILWTMITPEIDYTIGAPQIYLGESKSGYQLRDINIFDDPDLLRWMMDTYGKYLRGHISPKLRSETEAR